MNFLDLFAGIGGFRMGMERAGHTCIGYVENNEFARKSYEAIHDTKGEWTAHDITQVTDEQWRELKGRVDIICGGFPCQAFSVAGKRKGFEDTRGTLFFEIARAAQQIEPCFLLLENVKGLLSHDKGETFASILATLDELGFDAEWQVLNSKDFGVPQNRERVFIIGHSRRYSRREIFPFREDDRKTDSAIKIIGHSGSGGQKGYIHDIEGSVGALSATDYKQPKQIGIKQLGNIYKDSMQRENPEAGRIYDKEGLAPSLSTMQGGQREPKILDDQGRTTKKLEPKDLCPTLRSESHGNEPKIIIDDTQAFNGVRIYEDEAPTLRSERHGLKTIQPVMNPGLLNKKQNGRRFKNEDEPMFTLTEQDRHGIAIKEATKKGYDIAEPGDSVNFSVPGSETRRGRVGKDIANTIDTGCQQGVVIEELQKLVKETRPNEEIGITIKENGDLRPHRLDERKSGLSELNINHEQNPSHTVTSAHSPKIYGESTKYRIRKLTPKECWRLQSFPDWAFERAEKVNSNSQLYKQAGNAVTVNVVYELAKRLK